LNGKEKKEMFIGHFGRKTAGSSGRRRMNDIKRVALYVTMGGKSK
jgi:hypothetical protein